MALKRKQQRDEIAALIEQGAAELRVSNPELFADPQPLSDEVIEELLRGDEEIQRIWDEMDRQHPERPHVSAADIVIEDRGEY
jgi:hypothetical protein